MSGLTPTRRNLPDPSSQSGQQSQHDPSFIPQPIAESPPAPPLSGSLPSVQGARVSPTVMPRNLPLCGSLNGRDALFYIQASSTLLRAIIASFPDEFKNTIPPDAPHNVCLAAVLKLRQQEAVQKERSTPKLTPLEQLLTMETSNIIDCGNNNPSKLRQLMEEALRQDPGLSSGTLPQEKQSLIITALSWQLQSHKNVQAPSPSTQPHPTPFPRLSFSPTPITNAQTLDNRDNVNRSFLKNLLSSNQVLPNPRAEPCSEIKDGVRFDSSDDEEASRSKKKKKSDIVLQGFHYGAASSIDQVLSSYTGKRPGSNSLDIEELQGPEILTGIINKGDDVPTFLGKFKYWRKTAAGLPTASEMEAHTLGRMIHMELLSHASPKEALENRPSLEIGLRRLYAILYVEEKTFTGAIPDRGDAWREIQFLMESLPSGTVECDSITEQMTRRMNLEKKRITALKTMHEIRPKRQRANHSDPPAEPTNTFPSVRRTSSNLTLSAHEFNDISHHPPLPI